MMSCKLSVLDARFILSNKYLEDMFLICFLFVILFIYFAVFCFQC